MSDYTLGKDEALAILQRYTKSKKLIRHGLAVGAAMRRFASVLGEDADKWGSIGLLHDVDYEMYPDQHCVKSKEILANEGLPEDWIRSVLSHGWNIMPGVTDKPVHPMEWVLYTVDQLTGLIAATALMRPSKSLMDLEAKSVRKKWKDKAFAAGVDREVISTGAEQLGMELGQVIGETIAGMRAEAQALGLAGATA